jgi:hypothetical protein
MKNNNSLEILENHLELSEEMKERIKTLENIKKEDMLSSDEALAYLKNIKKKSK